LTEDLWNPRDEYDAAHYLMIPMQHAFASGNAARQQEFAAYFARLVASGMDVLEERLHRLQHLYLAGRFAVLATQAGKSALIPAGLVEALGQEVERMWIGEPSWQWGREPFPGGMSERIRWKLDTQNVALSYYRTIIDEELFTFGIAADVKAVERLTGAQLPQSPLLDDVLATAREVFVEEVVRHSDGGWLLQPGVWTDHRDYRYAGHDAIAPDLEPALVPGISWDTSHSHRMPMLLTSLESAYPPGSEANNFYADLKAGLEVQFYNHVLVGPSAEFPGYRTTNFMDGRNGLYRHFPGRADGFLGYEPFRLSGTMFIGWWSALDTQRMREVYRRLSEQFPLTDQMLQTYDVTVSRDRHPIVYWDSGVHELLVLLAAEDIVTES
jgi:hypothetical protein